MEKEQSVHEVMEELAELMANAIRTIAEFLTDVVEYISSVWENMKACLEENNGYHEPKRRHGVIKDMRRSHQVMTNRPMNIVRRVNM